MFRRPLTAALLALAVAATGCGASPTTPEQAGGGSAPPTTAAARTTDVPTAPTAAVAPTTAPAAPAASATEAVPAAAVPTGPYAGVEQSRTSEGYHVLGSANAPVTFVMYSDFF